MDRKSELDWIELEYFGRYGGGHYKLQFEPLGIIEYKGDLVALQGHHKWSVPKRVFNNLAKILLDGDWEKKRNPVEEDSVVCDGSAETLRWSIKGDIQEYTVEVGIGPPSILKVIGRISDLVSEEAKNHPPGIRF